MERASRLIRLLQMPQGSVDPEDLVRAAWNTAVGKKIAANSRFGRLSGPLLEIHVEDEVWAVQLKTLSTQILSNLEKNLGSRMVRTIQFRVVPLRRGPQRAPAAASADEADRIDDPILRAIYRTSRSRALA
jgi:predicted nucleic acid-binding Zn ribbon protein